MANKKNEGIEALKETKSKKVNVKVIDMIRASYGAFDVGEIVELDEAIAKELEVLKIVEIVK